MDFATEPWLKLYKRRTVTWNRLPWEGQAMLPNVLQCLDRSGEIPLCGLSPEEAVAALHQRWPEEVVAKGVRAMLDSGIIEERDGHIVWPKFHEGQETRQSDAARKRRSREKRQTSHQPSPNVTTSHQRSPRVTKRIEEKRIEERTPPIVPPTGGEAKRLRESFSSFWKAYPVKKDVHTCERLWHEIAPSEAVVATILSDIEEKRREDKDWLRGFAPQAKTYLRDRRWQDETVRAGESTAPPPESPDGITADEVVEEWNEIAKPRGLPVIEALTPELRGAVDARIRRWPTLEPWQRLLGAVSASSYLQGRKNGFRATLDWLMESDDRFARVIEGKYADGGN